MSDINIDAAIRLNLITQGQEKLNQINNDIAGMQRRMQQLTQFRAPLQAGNLFSNETVAGAERYWRGMQRANIQANTWAQAQLRNGANMRVLYEALNRDLERFMVTNADGTRRVANLSGRANNQLRQQFQDTYARMGAVFRAFETQHGRHNTLLQRTVRSQDQLAAAEASQMLAGMRRMSQDEKHERRRVAMHDAEIRRQRERAIALGRQSLATPGRVASYIDGHNFFNSPAFLAMAGAGAAVAGSRRAIRSGLAIDTAQSNAQIFMDMDEAQSARLRERSTNTGVRMGVRPDVMMQSAVEASKAGVPDMLSESFAVMSTKLAKVFGMSVQQTTDDMGYAVAQELGAGRLKADASGLDVVRRIGNTAGYLASKMATRPDAMMSFMRTGMGTGGMLGLNQTDTLAFGAAATSVGAQGQQASRMLGHLSDQMYQMPLDEKNIRRKKTKSAEDKLFLEIPTLLGYGSYKNLFSKLKQDPGELFNLIARFNPERNPRMKDNFKREQAMSALFGADFKRFISALAMSPGVMEDARKHAGKGWREEAGDDFQTRSWEVHKRSFEHMVDTIDAAWSALTNRIGLAFKPFMHDVSVFMSRIQKDLRSAKFERPLQEAFKGLINGFGFKDLEELLGQFQIGRGRFNTEPYKQFGVGVGETLTTAFKVVKGVFTGIAGVLKMLGIAGAKETGQLIGGILGLAFAMRLLRPALAIGGLALAASRGLFTFGQTILAFSALTKAQKATSFLSLGASSAGAGAAGTVLGSTLLFNLRSALLGAFQRFDVLVFGRAAGTMLGRLFGGALLGIVASIGVNQAQISNWLLTNIFRPATDAAYEGVKSLFTSLYDGVLKAIEEFKTSVSDGSIVKKGTSALMHFLDPNIGRWFDNWANGQQPPAERGSRPPANDNGQAEPPARFQRQSYGGYSGAFDNRLIQPASFAAGERDERFGGYNGAFDSRLIRPASFQTGDSPLAGMLHRVAAMASPNALAAVARAGGGAGGLGVGPGGFGGGGGGGSVPTPAVPGWFNRGNGSQGGGIPGGSQGASTPAYGMAGKTFDQKAPGIMANLMKDFGLTKEQAAGIVGNLGHESAGFTAYQEGKPLGGGRGGAGWAQWTGPRRRAFEAWAASKGLDPRSDEANYGFLKHELQGTHAHALANLKKTNNHRDATVQFEKDFEAAGVKHYDRRFGYADRAMGMNPDGAQPNPNAGASPNAGANVTGGAAGAVDVAQKYLGMDENRDNAALKGFMGKEIRGAQNAWCASFVNSSLEAVGLKSTKSGVANSYLNWGKGVDANEVQKGDVAVEHRNKGANNPGGHVGLATGNKRINPKTGELEIEVISGNNGNKVATDWEKASAIALRRSTEEKAAVTKPEAAADAKPEGKDAFEAFKSSGWKRDTWSKANGGPWKNERTGEEADEARTRRLDENAAIQRERIRQRFGGVKRGADGNPIDTGADLIRPGQGFGLKPKADGQAVKKALEAPDEFKSSGWKPAAGLKPTADMAIKPTMDNLLSKMPPAPKPAPASPGAGQGGGAGNGVTPINAQGGAAPPNFNITIHAGNQSPREMTSHLQRHIAEMMNYRSHDMEPELT